MDRNVPETAPFISPSLSSSRGENSDTHRTSLLKAVLRWIVIFLIWVIFIFWVAFLFFYPLQFVQDLLQDWESFSDGTIYGITGSMLVVFSGPILVIALLAVLYSILCDDDQGENQYEELIWEKSQKTRPSYSLWTIPVIVEGPFGIVSGAELIAIVLFIVAVVWALIAYVLQTLSELDATQLSSILMQWAIVLEVVGVHLGLLGLFCLSFLFLPIARGSVLLRLIDIPVEHASKYHKWLGNLTLLVLTLHGLSFVVAWSVEGSLEAILSWSNEGIAVLAGAIALLSGWIMWVTTLPLVRRKCFELFYYTHHLYIVFITFVACHVGATLFSIVVGGILIYMLDRFLRFCQSRKKVDIVSVTIHSCGVVELLIAKPANLRYNALSFVFIKASEMSLLQWHPFSVSSSPMDARCHLSVHIKAIGNWTRKLQNQISTINEDDPQNLQPFYESKIPLTVTVEGPYGHRSSYYLMYKNLVLVAGGIGITPFLAVLRDILHRIKDGRLSSPRKILLVWAIRRSDELSVLSSLDMESICPFFFNVLNLQIQIYITRQLDPSLEEGETYTYLNTSIRQKPKASGISSLVGGIDKKWNSIYVASSIIGFVLIFGLLDAYYIDPYVSISWFKGILLLLCMLASVVVIGGIVVALWHHFETKVSYLEEEVSIIENATMMLHQHRAKFKKWSEQNHTRSSIIQYGSRPNFKDIFDAIEENWGSCDVGVLACGPPGLQSSVAKEIRSHCFTRKTDQPIFHFHGLSFEL